MLDKEWKMKRKRNAELGGDVKKYIDLLSGLSLGKHCKTWAVLGIAVVKHKRAVWTLLSGVCPCPWAVFHWGWGWGLHGIGPPTLCSHSFVVTAFFLLPHVRRVTLSGQMAPPMTTTTGMAASLMMGSTPSRRRRTVCRSGTDTAVVSAQGTFSVICVSINSIHRGSCFSEEVAGRQRICILIF